MPRILPVLLLCAAALSVQAATNELDISTDPKWQAGLLLGAARLPHYRGSDAYEHYVVPIPFFVYRGEMVKAGRGGVRGVLFNNVRFDASVSMSGNPPVDSEDNAREGMPDLPPLLEAGPALKWWPAGRFDHASLYVELALRGTASIDVKDDWDTSYQGVRSELSLNYRRTFPRPDGHHWRVGCSVSGYAADARYHRFFYEVSEPYATDERPAYDAEGGYSGCAADLWISRRLTPRLTCGFYARADYVAGATFDDSPLVGTETTFAGGFAVVWTIAQSDVRVARDPDESGD